MEDKLEYRALLEGKTPRTRTADKEDWNTICKIR